MTKIRDEEKGNEKRQLTSLKSNKRFAEVFGKIILNISDIDDFDKEYILSCAIIFFNHYNLDKRYKSYFKIGYYIILKYSLLFEDYKPLYDISLQIGFYPISNFILDKKLIDISTVEELLINKSISQKYLSFEDYIETLEQNISSKKILSNQDKNIIYIAPTSYGKSSLIKEVIIKNNHSRIGIIVPTKSLLLQTYKDIKSLHLDYKLILHDEMYNGEARFIAILTQERATRLISKHKIYFDILFIDEAHKLLKRDSRSLLLTRLIQLNGVHNENQKLFFLTPLLQDEKNIEICKIPHKESYTQKIEHDLKINEIYFYDNYNSCVYDKFTGKELIFMEKISYFDYIKSNSLKKNFIYQRRPKLIEELSNSFSEKIAKVENSEEINKIITTLKQEVHRSFYLIPLIEKGLVYIHGRIPNIVKEYIEDKFKTISEIKYIIANQVILEGINLPIDNLFITSTYSLQGKDLINLIGRVNRLNYVFKKDDLNSLISKIHFINDSKYQGDGDMRNKLKLLRDHRFDDKIENPLLKEYNLDSLKLNKETKRKRELDDLTIIQESEILLSPDSTDDKGKLRKYIIENNINDFYNDLEMLLNVLIENIKLFSFTDTDEIISIVYKIFILQHKQNISDFEIERLKNEKARKYYNYYLNITQTQSLNQRINETASYFKNKSISTDPQMYIGTSYGEEVRYSPQYSNSEYQKEVYIDLSKKTNTQLINLAIVKLKIEEDFVGFKLNKLIVFLYDFKLISEDYYFKYIYGTTNSKTINLVRFGLNVSIVKKLENDNQIVNLEIDANGNLQCNKDFSKYIESQAELFKFEINKYLM